MRCEKCGEPSLGPICVYCSGKRARTAQTVLTAEQWNKYMREAAERASALLKRDSESRKPGAQVLGYLLAAYALTNVMPELPSFEWYAAMVLNGVSPPAERCARCGILNPLMVDGVCQSPDCNPDQN